MGSARRARTILTGDCRRAAGATPHRNRRRLLQQYPPPADISAEPLLRP